MSSLFKNIVSDLQAEVDQLERRILEGAVEDWVTYRDLVAKRRATIKAIGVVKERFKQLDMGEDES